MGIKEELGKKIKRMRINRKMTQEELSEKINISQRALSAIERGENFVTAETLDKLLITLDTDSEELFSTKPLHHKNELINAINKNIERISNDLVKLDLLYNISKILSKE